MKNELQALPCEEAHEELLRILGSEADQMTFDGSMALMYGLDFVSNPDLHPPYCDYIYTAEDILAGEEIWTQWENAFGNISEKVKTNQDNLQKLNVVAIGEAERETANPWVTEGIRHLSKELTSAGIDHDAKSYDGTYVSLFANVVLPFFSENLESEE